MGMGNLHLEPRDSCWSTTVTWSILMVDRVWRFGFIMHCLSLNVRVLLHARTLFVQTVEF